MFHKLRNILAGARIVVLKALRASLVSSVFSRSSVSKDSRQDVYSCNLMVGRLAQDCALKIILR